MNRRHVLAAACLFGLACDLNLAGAAAPALPAPVAATAPVAMGLDAAKKALAEKRYDDVDASLALLLAQKLPDPAVLRVSLDAALASGRFVTASQRANELLKASAGKDLDVLFITAAMADLTGDTRGAQVRYLAFARQSEAKSANLEMALDYVLRREAYPEEYKKFVKLFGADAHAWRVGQAQLARLVEAADATRTLDLADYLIDTFPEPEHTLLVQAAVWNAAEAFVFGKEPKDRYLRPLQEMVKHPGSSAQWIDPLFSRLGTAINDEQRARLVIELVSHLKGPLSTGIQNQFAQDLRSLKSPDVQAQLARAYLAAAPLHEAADKESHYWFLRTILESPQVFHIKGAPLVTDEAARQKVAAYIAKYPAELGHIHELVIWTEQNYLGNDPAARIAFLQEHLTATVPQQFAGLVSLMQGVNLQATYDKWAAGRSYRETIEARMQLLPVYNTMKDKASLVSGARDYMSANPYSFNKDQIWQYVISSTLLDANEKLALLKEEIEKAGYTEPMKALLDGMVASPAWVKDENFKQLKAAFDQKPVGKDPASVALVALHAAVVNQAQPNPAAVEAAKKFLQDYKGAVPAGGDKVTSLAEMQADDIFLAHAGHVWNNAAAVFAWAEMWAPRLPLGTNWESMTTRVRAHEGGATLSKLLPIYAGLVRAGGAAVKPSPTVWQNFWGATGPDGVSPLASVYDLMGPDLSFGYVYNQRTAWDTKKQFEADELGRVVTAMAGKPLTDPAVIRGLMDHVWNLTTNATKVTPEISKALWDAYLADLAKGGVISPAQEGRTHGSLIAGKHDAEAAAWLTPYLQLLEKRTPQQRLDALNELMHWSYLPVDVPVYAGKPGSRRTVLLKVLKPLYEQVSPRDFDAQDLTGNPLMEIGAAAVAVVPTAKDPEAAAAPLIAQQKKEALDLGRLWLKMLAAGAKLDAPGSYMFGIAQANLDEAVKIDDRRTIALAAAQYGDMMSRDNLGDPNYTQQIAPVLKVLEDRGDDEAEYVFVAAIQHGKSADTVVRQLMIAKAKAATRIRGLIPVPPSDPTYDLYLASASLMGGDESKAWELTAPKLKLLMSNWESYDSRYIAWSIDQMRKQKMLKESLEFSFNVLLREVDLDAETAAKVLLSQSDVYKDMENYQAARIGYEGLKSNARYTKTEGGQKAVYRLVELHIVTKDYTAAETLLERMVDADDVKKQAEAFYLYAEMAYQQGQYKEAKDYLKKVKSRVANHVEGALLEGQLNLILPGGLANTEVAIGDPRLSTVVIPGRYLVMELQDPNLSVARGGSAIPVIVTTSKGGDVEHVKLIPSSSNKSLFSARIATTLGKAQKDDLTLELVGDDVVSYVIDPEFQKANDLHYPPKELAVRDDARLVASSGEILSEEEEEKRALERQLQQRQTVESRQLDVARDGHTIRPGSSIYVQVTDAAMSLDDKADTVKIDLRTSSGELLDGFTLNETAPHTGVFRGAVPTGIPSPKALASDFEDGKEPFPVIHPGAGEGWVSLADGRKNKWLEVDTMSSHEVSSVTFEIPHLDTVKDIGLLGMLADDYEELASLPAQVDAIKGGVQIEVSNNHAGDTIESMRRHLKLAAIETVAQEAPAYIRESTPLKGKGDSWGTSRLRGSFYLAENKALDLKYLQAYEGYGMRCFVIIDGQTVLEHFNQQSAAVPGRIDLTKGVHTLEILCDDLHANNKVIVGYRQADGTYAALPAEWFSVQHHPELAEYLRPKGKITVAGDILTATFDKPVRIRKVKAMFRDFTSTAIGVKHVTITDSAGKAVVPVVAAPGAKGVLAIAPGDLVTVSYNDTRRLHGETKVLTSALNSSYYNGTIALAEETIVANPGNPQERYTEFLEAKRCRAGDQLMVVVTDYDEDTTDARDTVDVKVTTSSGETLTLKALETAINHSEDWNPHAGQFLAVLKFGNQTKGDTIKVVPGDRITVTYIDKENTDPGIPIERSYSVTEAGAEAPAVTVYRTKVKMVVDESPEAKARLKRIAGRETKGAVLYKPLTVARHPDYVPPVPTTQPAAERKEIVASVDAPLLFDVTYPRRALNAGSILEVTAVAESEMQAAAKEKRSPVELKVPTYIQSIDRLAQIKGYPMELQSAVRKSNNDMLKGGSFSGIIRLQVGSKGDPLDDMVVNGEFASEAQRLSDPQGLLYKIPTLLVSGSDVVHIRVKDESSGQVVDTPVRLLSDARLDLLDPSYVIANESIHLGEKFHVRITDADHDTTNDRDTVTVKAKASSGSEALLTLTETLPHSGIFTGTLEPKFIREIASTQPSTRPATTAPAEPTLKVDFGDTVTFTYVDDLSLESTSPVTVLKAGKILLGSDAQVVSFTKRFKDPEIAVKTRFLMAEALFETAKEHRKIGEMAQADQEIVRGKNILDEAIRDYPNTTLAPQGEYLLANLAQELANYQEAVGRYANVISSWPDSEYAAGSQFKQALCFEKMGKNDQAVEEYVKLTYLYPDSPLVADATIRLGNYYLKNQSFKTAGKIFSSFQQRNPTHRLAPQALFLAAQCAYKQAEFKEALALFTKTAEAYPDEKSLRPEAMYWQADSATKMNDNVTAFRTFKKVTWDFPESQWAKAARGRLTEETFSRMQEQEGQ